MIWLCGIVEIDIFWTPNCNFPCTIPALTTLVRNMCGPRYPWRNFLSYPTTFLTCKRTISSCLHATEEIVDGSRSYHVDVLCVDYPSHLTITCGYEVLFYLIPLISLLVRELYHLVSMLQRK
jgi:hypothetical protein